MPKSLLLIAIFLSGVSALMYQVVWLRQLSLVFGTTAFAVSAVLSAFMAGLALGSVVLGRYVDRVAHPLRLYIFLELGIGLFALLTPLLFGVIDDLYALLFTAEPGPFLMLSLWRFALAFSVVGVAAALMGGTLPVLVKIVNQESLKPAATAGSLYGINTMGAVTGVGLSSFLLLPVLGVTATMYTAVLINLVIGFVLLMLSFGRDDSSPATMVSLSEISSLSNYPLLALFALSGFTALAYEVIWTRVLERVIGASVYAFAVILLTFLVGLAVGSILMVRGLALVKGRELWVMAMIQVLIALAAGLVIYLLGQAPLFYVSLAQLVPLNFMTVQMIQLGLVFVCLLPATLLFGAFFPVMCQACGVEKAALGHGIGRLYAFNTAGAVLGAFAAGFIFLPLLGSEQALMLMVALNIGLGMALMLIGGYRQGRSRSLIAISAAVLAAVILLPAWNPLLMNSNIAYMLKAVVEKPERLENYLSSQIVYVNEDASAQVLVYQGGDGSLNLQVNGHAEGGTRDSDMPVQTELARIPAVMHGMAKKVLLVGLGPGITLAELAAVEGVEQIDVVEISAAVVGANEHFAKHNGGVLKDERVNLIVDDARHYLSYSEQRYDLIIVGPSYTWLSGSASLFTQEFMLLAKRHLNEGGLLAQWFQLYGLSEGSIRLFVATLNSVFPHRSLWTSANYAELIAISSDVKQSIDVGLLTRMMPPTLATKWVSAYLMDSEAMLSYAGDSPVNQDDRPRLEFLAPRQSYQWDLRQNITGLFAAAPTVTVAVKNASHQMGEQYRLPALGLALTPLEGQFKTDYANSHRLMRPPGIVHGDNIVELPISQAVPRLMVEEPGFRFELRATQFDSDEQLPSAELLIKQVAQVTGGALSAVKVDQLHKQALYWLTWPTAPAQIYVMTWLCKENRMQYLARIEMIDDQQMMGDLRGFTAVRQLLERRLQCYKP